MLKYFVVGWTFRVVQKLKDSFCLTQVIGYTRNIRKAQLILISLPSLPLLSDGITKEEKNSKIMTGY